MCLTQCACQEPVFNLGGKPGQVEARSTSQVIPTSSPVPEILSYFLVHAHAVDLFLFSRHTGHCWTSGLRAAKIAAKIKHAWLLEVCPSTQLVCPLLSTTVLAVTHPGEARTFSERPCSFCCQIGPANGIAECGMQVGRTLVTNGRSLGAGCARDAGSTQHDQARCRTVNRNHKFLFSIHTCDDADSPRKPAFARFRMALSRGTGIPLPSLLGLADPGRNGAYRLGSVVLCETFESTPGRSRPLRILLLLNALGRDLLGRPLPEAFPFRCLHHNSTTAGCAFCPLRAVASLHRAQFYIQNSQLHHTLKRPDRRDGLLEE